MKVETLDDTYPSRADEISDVRNRMNQTLKQSTWGREMLIGNVYLHTTSKVDR